MSGSLLQEMDSLILKNGSLLSELISLLRFLGKFMRNALYSKQFLWWQKPKTAFFTKIPCIFPVEQGNDT